jgi:hypothetical protein
VHARSRGISDGWSSWAGHDSQIVLGKNASLDLIGIPATLSRETRDDHPAIHYFQRNRKISIKLMQSSSDIKLLGFHEQGDVKPRICLARG